MPLPHPSPHQTMEEERLGNLSRVLHLMSDADINVLSIAAAVHRLSADKINSAEPHSDLRLFIHNKVVDLMLRQTAAAQRATAEKVGAREGGAGQDRDVYCTPMHTVSVVGMGYRRPLRFGFRPTPTPSVHVQSEITHL